MRLPIPPVDVPASRQLAAQAQRDRLLFAVTTVVAERGYAAATVAHVIDAAGVSRRTFYEHFANIEDCFLAAYELGVARLEEIVTSAVAGLASGASWSEVVRTTLHAYLSVFASQPAFAKAAMIEVLGAGERARARYLENVARFEATIQALADQVTAAEGVPAMPDAAVRLASGGLARFVIVEALAGRAGELPEHTDELMDVIVRLLLGRGYGVTRG